MPVSNKQATLRIIQPQYLDLFSGHMLHRVQHKCTI